MLVAAAKYRNLSTKHIGFSCIPDVNRMEDPSSLSWSKHYGLHYDQIHQSLPQEQGQPDDEPLQNEVEFQQLGNQNQGVMGFHQTAEQRHGDPNVQGQSVSDQLHDYQRASSLQQFNSTPTANGENRRVSWEEILQVKHFVETCIKSYMTKNEVIKALSTHAKIDPSFTCLVWQRLERENHEFFRNYYIWLKVKEQILLFNRLLEQQHQLIVMERALDIQQPHLQTRKQHYVVSSGLSTQLTHQITHFARDNFGNEVERDMEVPAFMQPSSLDASSMRNMSFNQASAVPSIEAFSSNPPMTLGAPFTACNVGGLDGNGFLHMGSLEGLPGSIEQFPVTRRTAESNTEFPNNQGGFSGHAFFSSRMDTFLSPPFQNTCEDRIVEPVTEPVYNSYRDKGLDDYMLMHHPKR